MSSKKIYQNIFMFNEFFYSNLLITDIVHNDLECYVESEYGGKKIKKWPFYTFIKEWIDGNYEQARNLWIEWLVNEFSRYCLEIKSKGGMYQGSVHRYAIDCANENKDEFWLNPNLLSKKFVIQGASMLVDRRIELIRSIRDKGYQINLNDPILAVKIKDYYVFKGGHHRVAIMSVLGYRNLPGVIVYPKPLWECRKWLMKIKKYLK